jgi:hypothetical protein
MRRARKYPNKQGENLFGFVEFADRNSVDRALTIASARKTVINGVKFRIFKAGTGTFIFCKKTAKQKKLEMAKKALPPTPYDVPVSSKSKRKGARR